MRTCPHCQTEIYDLADPEYNHEPFGDQIAIWVTGHCRNCQGPLRIGGTGDVEVGELPTQDGIIEEAASMVLERLHEPGETSRQIASEWAADQIEDEYPWFEPEVGSGSLADLILNAVDEQTPAEFRAEIAYDEERGHYLKNVTGCPNCGNEAIFNASPRYNMQMVKSTDGDDAEYVADDIGGPRISTISCGRCFEELSPESSA